ncbi:MAG: WD40/YVTN/BNR-like repeat-containing protein, partial [Bacteroidia bacterium]
MGQGWIEDIIIEDDAWYAGSITGGLYKSKNKGKKWKKIDNDTVQMGTLCLLKSNGVLYRGTGVTHYGEDFGLGLLKSLDDGKTWSSTGLNFKPEEEKPLWDIDVSSDGTLAACTPNEVYISKDQGISWEIVYSGEKCDFRTVLFSSDGKTLLVSGNILLRSENLGENWTECTSVIEESIPEKYNKSIARIAICKDPNISNRFLAFYGVKNDGYIMESSDNGRTWHLYQKHKNIRRADVHHTEIAIAPDNSSVIVLGTYRTYLSTDNGETFETVTNPGHQSPQFAHDDIRGMYLKGPGEFYLATDGGVFMTIDTAKTWINVSGKGLSVMQIYGFTELEDGRFLMGCQDMSYFTLEKKEWTQLGSYYGDGGDAFETSKGQYILLGGRVKNIDISEIYKSTTIHPARTNPFIAKFYEYPNALDSFFYVGHDLWMFNGRRWNNLSNNISRGQHMIMGFDINESNPNQVFIAYDQPTWSGKRLSNKFYKSNDGGMTWNDITSNLPILAWRHITSISSNMSNPNEIYVSL